VKSQGSYSWPVTSVIDITLANHRNSISPYFDRPSKVSFDEVGVWSSALTPCEVIALYLEGSPNYIVQQPVGQFQAAGGTVKFYIPDTGTNTAYQWQSNSGMGYQNLSNAGQYGGVFSDTLTV